MLSPPQSPLPPLSRALRRFFRHTFLSLLTSFFSSARPTCPSNQQGSPGDPTCAALPFPAEPRHRPKTLFAHAGASSAATTPSIPTRETLGARGAWERPGRAAGEERRQIYVYVCHARRLHPLLKLPAAFPRALCNTGLIVALDLWPFAITVQPASTPNSTSRVYFSHPNIFWLQIGTLARMGQPSAAVRLECGDAVLRSSLSSFSSLLLVHHESLSLLPSSSSSSE